MSKRTEGRAKGARHDGNGSSEAEALDAFEAFDTANDAALGSVERRKLDRVSRFLITIQSPMLLRRARPAGYTPAEHTEGWTLWKKAAGEERPLDHFIASEQFDGMDPGFPAVLKEIDAFENRWFPIARAIIRRKVPAEGRTLFETAFFRDLTQQPLGPGVVGSVRTFLERVESLEKSTQPGAKEVRKALEGRGLDKGQVTQMRALLAQLEKDQGVRTTASKYDPKTIAAAQAEQRQAFEDVQAWFHDWATTLRPVFNAREQLMLGLTVLRRNGTVVEEDTDSGEEVAGPAPA